MFIKNGNGLRMISVLIDAEVSNKRIVGTATDVLGLISCLGVADSGFPLLIVIGRSSWPCIETVFVDRNMTVIFDLPPPFRVFAMYFVTTVFVLSSSTLSCPFSHTTLLCKPFKMRN